MPPKKAKDLAREEWRVTAMEALTDPLDAAHLIVGLVNTHGLDKLNAALEEIGAGTRVKDAEEFFDDPDGAVCKDCHERSTDPNHAANCSWAPDGGKCSHDGAAELNPGEWWCGYCESSIPAPEPAGPPPVRPPSPYGNSIIKILKCDTVIARAVEELMRVESGGCLDGLYPDEFRKAARKALRTYKALDEDTRAHYRGEA